MLQDPAVEMVFPGLELDHAHVTEHLIRGLHPLVAIHHQVELVSVVALRSLHDKYKEKTDGDGRGKRCDSELEVEKDHGGSHLKRHQPEVVQLEHHVGELLRVNGHVVDDLPYAVGLARGAGKFKSFAVERGDEGGTDEHPKLLRLEIVLVGANHLHRFSGQEDPAEIQTLERGAAVLGAGEVDEPGYQ